MERKWYVLIFVSLAVAVVAVGWIILYEGTGFSPFSSDLEECKVLEKNLDDGIDIVFFSKKGEAERYMKYFLGFKPFDNYNDKFNFFYIEGYEPECEIYKGVALLCYSKELVRKAGSCPNDYIVVLDDRKSSLRSSAYLNVMSININHPLSVLMHEFAHAFANFAEEYVPAKLPRGAKNCVVECENFQEYISEHVEGKGFEWEIDGCYEGCSIQDYIRSVDNGIMRTLRADNYGKFNDGLLVERIEDYEEESFINSPLGGSLEITGLITDESVDCSNKEYYLIEGNYNRGNIEITGRSVEKGCVGDSGFGPFSFNFILDNESTIEEGKFNPELIFTSAPDLPGEEHLDGEVFENEGKFYLKVPIVDRTKRLEINDIDKGIVNKVNLYDIGGRLCLVE